MTNIVYQDKDYLLTNDEFTYKGTKEPIQKVNELRLIKNDTRRKLINGSVGAFIMLGITLCFVPMFNFIVASDSMLLWILKYLIPSIMVIIGFSYKYHKTKDFSLEIEKSSGNTGIIDKSNCKDGFENLIRIFDETKKTI